MDPLIHNFNQLLICIMKYDKRFYEITEKVIIGEARHCTPLSRKMQQIDFQAGMLTNIVSESITNGIQGALDDEIIKIEAKSFMSELIRDSVVGVTGDQRIRRAVDGFINSAATSAVKDATDTVKKEVNPILDRLDAMIAKVQQFCMTLGDTFKPIAGMGSSIGSLFSQITQVWTYLKQLVGSAGAGIFDSLMSIFETLTNNSIVSYIMDFAGETVRAALRILFNPVVLFLLITHVGVKYFVYSSDKLSPYVKEMVSVTLRVLNVVTVLFLAAWELTFPMVQGVFHVTDSYHEVYPEQSGKTPNWYTEVTPQSGGDLQPTANEDGLGVIVRLFLTLFASADLARFIDSNVAHGFVKCMEKFARWSAKDLGTFVNCLTDVFRSIYDKICGISGTSKSGSSWALLGRMASDIEEIRILAKEEEWVKLVNSDALEKVNNFIVAIDDMLGKVKQHSRGSTVYNTLVKLLQRTSETKLLLDGAIGVSAGERVQPVSIIFRGEPGRGKTKTLDALKDELTMSYLDETSRKLYAKAPGLFVFTRNIEVEFWDGYHPSVVTTIIDDFAQERESNAKTNQFMEFIRLANTHACPLRMAELSRKANSYFNSKYILMSTNRKTDSDYQSIISKEAVDRRIDFDVRCDFLPVFIDGEGMLKYEMLECVDVESEDGGIRKMPVFSPAAMRYIVSGVEVKKNQLVRFKDRECTYQDIRSLAIKLHNHRMRVYKAEALLRQSHLNKGKNQGHDAEISMNPVDFQANISSKIDPEFIGCFEEVQDFAVSAPSLDDVPLYMLLLALMKYANPACTLETLDQVLANLIGGRDFPECSLKEQLLFASHSAILHLVKGELTKLKFLYLCMAGETDVFNLDKDTINKVFRDYTYLIKKLEEDSRIVLPMPQLLCMEAQVKSFLLFNLRLVANVSPMRVWLTSIGMKTTRFRRFFSLVLKASSRAAYYLMQLTIVAGIVPMAIGAAHAAIINTSHNKETGMWGDIDTCEKEIDELLAKGEVSVSIVYEFFTNWYSNRKAIWHEKVGKGKMTAQRFHECVSKMDKVEMKLRTAMTVPQSNLRNPPKDKSFRSHPYSYEGLYSSATVNGVSEQSPTPADRAHRRFRVHNLYEFSIIIPGKNEMEEVTMPMGTILFVRGSMGVYPKHFSAILQGYTKQLGAENVDVSLRTVKVDSRDVKEYRIKSNNFLKRSCYVDVRDGTIRDVAFVDCSGIVPPSRDIYRYFYSRQEFQTVPARVRLYILNYGESETTIHDCPVPRESAVIGAMKVDGELVPIVDTIPYVCDTNAGDCGSLVISQFDAKLDCRIIGYHTSQSQRKDCSYGSVVFTDDLDIALRYFSRRDVRQTIGCSFISVVEDECMNEVDQQGFRHFTVDGPPEHLRSDFSSSKLARSPIGALLPWPTAKIPAKLRPFRNRNGCVVDPYELALANYAPPLPAMPEFTLVKAKENYMKSLQKLSVRDEASFCRILSFEEAVAGIDGCQEVGSISRSTSAGYPYNTRTGRFEGDNKGKFSIFGSEPDYDFSTPAAKAVRNSTEEVIAKAEENGRSEHIFCDTLKDELREREKVLEGKTRMFSGGPLVFLIAQRQYFGAFDAFYKRTRISNGSAIGVNPYSDEWATIVHHLCEVKAMPNQRNFGAIDHSKFDARECGFIHLLILDIIEDWYVNNQPGVDPEELSRQAMVRRVLWTEIINSKHLWQNTVYEWDSSLPSGCPLTATINTMYNNIAFHYCLLRACGEDIDVDKNLRLIALGDDCVFSVSDQIVNKLNEYTVPIYMAEIGLKATREDKTAFREHDALLRPLTECTFLKRSFRAEEAVPCKWVGPLSLETVLEMPMWWREIATRHADLESSCQLALDELSLHGVDVFKRFGTPITKAYYQYFMGYPKRYMWVDCLQFVTNDSRYAL